MGLCFIILTLINLSVTYSQLVPKTSNGSLYDTVGLMALQGFKGERHEVKTEDGYKLVLFRIPPAKSPAPAVFLQHALSLTSDIFCLEKTSLAFMLSRKGYDVWIGNVRGNAYSHSHEKLSSNDTKFWDFSYHEMGNYDLPAFIDYILLKTKQPSLYYIGHSLGTTAFFVMGSQRPEYNKKIKSVIHLAPIAYYTGKAAMFGKQATYVEMAKKYIDIWIKEEKVEAFPRIDMAHGYHQGNCSDYPENFVSLCSSVLEMLTDIIGGPYFPAGFSTKTLIHYWQNLLTDTFRQYDLGSESANKAMYKTATPPVYNLSLVTAPSILVYGNDDIFLHADDITRIKGMLPNVVEVYKVPDPQFGHNDFMFVLVEEDEEDRTHFRIELNEQIGKWLDKSEKA